MSNDRVFLRSRNNTDFNAKSLGVVRALAVLLDHAVVDGEVVALDRSGRSSFNAPQNLASSKLALVYYIFDVVAAALWQSRCRSAAICSGSGLAD